LHGLERFARIRGDHGLNGLQVLVGDRQAGRLRSRRTRHANADQNEPRTKAQRAEILLIVI
jgi:hypothetical protein